MNQRPRFSARAAAGAAAALLLLLPALAPAPPFTLGSVTFDTDNSVQEATVTFEGTNTASYFNAPIQGAGNPSVDDDHHIGTLLGDMPGFAIDITAGLNGAAGRTIIEMNWGPMMAAENVAGPDLFVLESGTVTSPTSGFPEAFAVAVREFGSGTFSAYRYEFFTDGDTATLKLLTPFDFSDFGLAAGARVDAIRLISLHNDSATTPPNLEDRALDASGAGELVLDAGGSTGFAIQQGPQSGNPGTYPDSAMDADISYVVAASVVSTATAVDAWVIYE